ncbi:MAG: glyoxalase [Saprospiraceae bacterium]|nr:glyoxalase [Saprospiraceae bacterium]
MEREPTIIQLRPNIETIAESAESSVLEFFQNKTIRPILKLQNQVLIEAFKGLNRQKVATYSRMADIQKREWLRNMLSKDAIARNVILGIVLGMMTSDELGFFFDHEKECRQRIMDMVAERLASQVV